MGHQVESQRLSRLADALQKLRRPTRTSNMAKGEDVFDLGFALTLNSPYNISLAASFEYNPVARGGMDARNPAQCSGNGGNGDAELAGDRIKIRGRIGKSHGGNRATGHLLCLA